MVRSPLLPPPRTLSLISGVVLPLLLRSSGALGQSLMEVMISCLHFGDHGALFAEERRRADREEAALERSKPGAGEEAEPRRRGSLSSPGRKSEIRLPSAFLSARFATPFPPPLPFPFPGGAGDATQGSKRTGIVC